MSACRTFPTVLVATIVLICTAPLRAQFDLADPIVTSVSQSGADLRWSPDTGAPAPLNLGTILAGGHLDLGADRQLMIYSPAGRAVITLLGPASLAVHHTETEIQLDLSRGRICVIARAAQSQQPVHVRAVDRSGGVLAEAAAGFGATLMFTDGTDVQAAFLPETDGEQAMKWQIGGGEASVGGDQLLSKSPGAAQKIGPRDDWIERSGFEPFALAQRLGVASAQTRRLPVQTDLLIEVVEWDRASQPSEVAPLLESKEFKPEIRQVQVTLSNAIESSTNRGGTPETVSVAGANQVPVFSPAAIGVGGVTAVLTNNARANQNLTQTSSRGLGFGGPSQLAIPGITNGIRTIGPSGLGG